METNKQEHKMEYDNIVDTQKGMEMMKGKTFVKVEGSVGSGEMLFVTAEGERFLFAHLQDCCETVDINDIVGDLQDLVGSPMLVAEEVKGATEPDEEHYESYSYTFYKFATLKGYVDVRWLGESNGYYSESVDLFVEGVTVAEEQQPSLGELFQNRLTND
jgi:hypothetical protein